MSKRTQTTPGCAAPKWLATGSWVMLLALLQGGRIAEWAFALSAALFPVFLIALGTRRTLCRRRRWLLPVLGLVLGLSTAGILLGWPAGSGLMLIGLGLLPLVLVTWAYTVTFDES